MSIQPFILSAPNLFPRYIADVIAVYDQNDRHVFPGARPVKAIITEASKLMEHPLEDGSSIVDHSIILPVEIELDLVLQARTYKQTYDEIKQFYLTRSILTVQTRADVFTNQIILSMPHEENPEYYNTLLMQLRLKQANFVTPEVVTSPENPNNKSTVNRGTIEPKPATAKADTILFGWLPS